MKITNLSTKDSKQLKFGHKDIKASEHEITRRLLEKYKPKHHCKSEDIREINKRRKVA